MPPFHMLCSVKDFIYYRCVCKNNLKPQWRRMTYYEFYELIFRILDLMRRSKSIKRVLTTRQANLSTILTIRLHKNWKYICDKGYGIHKGTLWTGQTSSGSRIIQHIHHNFIMLIFSSSCLVCPFLHIHVYFAHLMIPALAVCPDWLLLIKCFGYILILNYGIVYGRHCFELEDSEQNIK